MSVERKIDGCLIKSLKESVIIYLKHWMIVDIISMIGMIISFHHRDLFFNFVEAVKKDAIDTEMNYVEQI